MRVLVRRGDDSCKTNDKEKVPEEHRATTKA